MRLSALLLAIAACSAPPADAPDATSGSICLTTGSGADESQCCLWDVSPCGDGLFCLWDGSTQNTAYCAAPAAAPAPTGATCQRYMNDCAPGDYCMPDPKSGSTTCLHLCRPDHGDADCAAGRCTTVSDEDASVGACL